MALVAFALAAPALLPLVADWGWTTPYDDAWIDLTTRGVFPVLLRPFFAAAALGLAWSLARRFRSEPLDPRLWLLAFGALTGAALACAGPGLGVIDVRFVPLAQLSLALLGALVLGAALGSAHVRLALVDVAALGLVLVAATTADSRSRVLRSWIDWNYSGLEAKELWPAWRELTETLRKGHDDGRVAVEYGPVHERAGSIRMYETLPFFSGRDTLEGVYNQAATTTHPVYYLASELFARSPNPFRSRSYSSFDPESAVPRLRLFNVSEIVAVSPELEAALAARPDVEREAKIPPYTLFRLREPGPGYVEPLAFAPLRASPHEWRDASYRWMTRKPANRALLVFTTDKRFEAAGDTWSPPTERPLADEVEVHARLEPESVSITTSRPGHPLLVKISYHPRWRAEGADGPYLVSPGLMMVVPRQAEVRLTYAARTWADRLGRTRRPGDARARPRAGGPAPDAGSPRPGRGRSRRSPKAPSLVRFGSPRGRCAPCRSSRSPLSPRCGSPPSALATWSCRGSTSTPRAPMPRIAGKTRPSTHATRSSGRRATTSAAASSRACAARRCCGRSIRGSPPKPSARWSTPARVRIGRRRSSRERSHARPRVTRPGPRSGARGCAPTTRRRPGPSASGRRPEPRSGGRRELYLSARPAPSPARCGRRPRPGRRPR